MENNTMPGNGITAMVPEDQMVPSALKLRKTYSIRPDAPIFQKEFGFYTFERWEKEGHIQKGHNAWEYDAGLAALFGYDAPGNHALTGLGWCEAAFWPLFEEVQIEDRGDHEVIRDYAGRHVLFFKGRRSGFMPEYLDHPVKDMKTWEENCKWRLDPKTPERYRDLNIRIQPAVKSAGEGRIITQTLIGGYMYLRSLIGPMELLYMFYDEPDLIHDLMETWFHLSDAVIAGHQEYLTIDELFLAEDICYNSGAFISPEHMREFLFPYYQQLITNVKRRQKDKNRHLYLQIDTDGNAAPVIPVYKEIGMEVMSPFEVASGCDVVEIGRRFPDLVLSGGIDKRILAESKDAIDRHLDGILPVMKKRGGYIPTCDHGVPEEVSFENYLHFRKRCVEYGK